MDFTTFVILLALGFQVLLFVLVAVDRHLKGRKAHHTAVTANDRVESSVSIGQ